MTRKLIVVVMALALSTFFISGAVASACSWGAYVNGKAAFVMRTVDWHHNDDLVVRGQGRNMKMKGADINGALEYTTKYACIQTFSFGHIVSDALNEKGLMGSVLYLDGSNLPPVSSGRKDIDPNNFIPYAVSNFATVQEVVDSLSTLNFVPSPNLLEDPEGKQLRENPTHWPFHYAFADATGDKAIIEFIDGKIEVHHGKDEDAMSNEPFYSVHKGLEAYGYRPDGSIKTIDRRSRAHLYMQDMYKRNVTDPNQVLMAMRGLMATVLAGTEELDPVANQVFPTQWWGTADLNEGKYYITRIESWCAEIYDFSMFNPAKAELVELKPLACPYPNIPLKK